MRNLPIFTFCLVLAISVSLLLYWVYEHGGLKHYLSAVDSINSLPVSEQVSAREQFYGNGEANLNLYGGVLMGVNTKGYGGIWVWGRKGPKYFKADEYSVFTHYQVCVPKTNEGYIVETFEFPKTVDVNITDWQARVQAGYWTTIEITGEGQGGQLGNLRQAISYDKWLFIPGTISNLCYE